MAGSKSAIAAKIKSYKKPEDLLEWAMSEYAIYSCQRNVDNTSGVIDWLILFRTDFPKSMLHGTPASFMYVEELLEQVRKGNAGTLIAKWDVRSQSNGPIEIEIEIKQLNAAQILHNTSQARTARDRAAQKRVLHDLLAQGVLSQSDIMGLQLDDIDLIDDLRLPDGGTVIEPIVGYRDFHLAKFPNINNPILYSRNQAPWPQYQRLIGLCTRWSDRGGIFAGHDVPNEDCQCGIYAFNDPDNHDMRSSTIWGEVNLWGKILICPKGYRAEYAYPKTIFVKDTGTKIVRTLATNLETAYGVPVHLVQHKGQTMAEILSEFMEGGAS